MKICARLALAGAMTLLLAIEPPAVIADDTAIVSDVSGSVGDQLPVLKEATKLAVAIQPDSTRLTLIPFSDGATRKVFELAKDRKAALRHVDDYQLIGGTNYLPALRQPFDQGSTVLFLSDGHPSEQSQKILAHVRSQLVPKGVVLCTASLNCDKGSKPEELLSKMAALTGGSYCRISNSEQLVKTLIEQSSRASSYYRGTPDDNEMRFTASGRVLVLAYDGDIQIDGLGRSAGDIQEHVARLPGERVALKWLTLDQIQPLHVKLVNPLSKNARLAAVYRSDLPETHLKIESSQGRVADGSQVQVEVSTTTSDGQPVDLRKYMTSTIQVADSDGAVIGTYPALPDRDRPTFSARIPVHGQGIRNIVATNALKLDDVTWEDVDESTVIVEKGRAATVTPASLQQTVEKGTFTESLTLKLADSHKSIGTWSARQTSSVKDCVRLISARPSQQGLELRFEAGTIGTHRGVVKIDHSDRLVSTLEVPFEFTVRPPHIGLAGPRSRFVKLGTVSAGHGNFQYSIPLQSLDGQAVEYDIQIDDLSLRGKILSTTTPDRLTLKPNQSTTIPIQIDVGLVPAGDYRGKLTVFPKGYPKDCWEFDLALTVTPAISGSLAGVVELPAGGFSESVLTIFNRGTAPVTGIQVDAPREFRQGGKVVSGIDVQVVTKSVRRIDGNSQETVTLKFAAQKGIGPRGQVTGDLTVRLPSGEAIQVPCELNLTDRQNAVLFRAVPGKLVLRARSGSLLNFDLRLRPQTDLMTSDQVELRAGEFQQGSDRNRVHFDFRPEQSRLHPGKPTDLKGAVLMPAAAGVYTGEIVICSTHAGRLSVPVELHAD